MSTLSLTRAKSTARKALVVHLLKKNFTVAAIAATVGLSEPRIYQIRREMVEPKQNAPRERHVVDKTEQRALFAKAKKMRNAGLIWKDIASSLGMKKHHLYQICLRVDPSIRTPRA